MIRTTILAAVAVASLSACVPDEPAMDTMGMPTGADVTVQMTPGLNFAPDPITIQAGQTVVFQNVSPFPHTVSTEPSTPAEAASTMLPPGAASFDSGSIPGGGEYRQTFTVPGTYQYFCDPHHGSGMTGTIIVSG